jgi:hypothetical protein
MANDNFNNAGTNAGQPLGTGEGESPIVQPSSGSAPLGSTPNIGVRTMNSDLGAIKSGETPKPYVPSGNPTPPPPAGMAMKEQTNNPSGFNLPEMDFGGPTPPVVGAPGSGTSSPSPVPPPKKGGKGIFALIITLIIVVGLAILGYFVIYPMFFATPTIQPAVTTNNQTPPAGNTISTNTPPAATTGPAITTTTTTASTTTATTTASASTTPETHVSLFKTPADESMTATTVVTGATIAGLNVSPVNAPKLVEVAYKDQTGNPIGFTSIMQTVFGLNLNSPALQNVWNDKNTAGFVYVDASGTQWLGYVTSVNASSSLAAVKTAFDQVFEANTNWAGAFVNKPGTPGTWKSGNTNGITNRYLSFSNGESINYGWVGNDLVISTSYAGFKDALSKL